MILHTEMHGEGEPLVFLHSGLMTGATDFAGQIEAFQQEYRVILPDLRGHGKSIAENWNNPFEDTADDLKETLDHYGISKCHLVGVSLGALVAVSFAKKHPQYLASLTLSGIKPQKPDDWEQQYQQEVQHLKALLQDEQFVGYQEMLHAGNDWRRVLSFAFDPEWYPFQTKSDFDHMNIPMFFLFGENLLSEVEAAYTYKTWLPHSHLAILPFCGHLPHQENAALYNDILHRFLQHVSEQRCGS